MTDETKQLKADLARLKKDCGIEVELWTPGESETPDCCRRKHREDSEVEALTKRLNRIEGQVRGIRGMVESEAYCTDILTQVSAVQSALNAFSRELLASHIRTCVVTDIQNGQLEVVDDLLATIQKLMK